MDARIPSGSSDHFDSSWVDYAVPDSRLPMTWVWAHTRLNNDMNDWNLYLIWYGSWDKRGPARFLAWLKRFDLMSIADHYG